jgi:hypothetical protein
LLAFLSFCISLIAIVISVVITVFFKNELEQMFEVKKAVIPFHICNLLIITIVSLAVFMGLIVNILGHHINILQQLTIFIFMILPIYFSGNLAFEQYKSPYCKYMITEDKKVIILNEKYLKRKKRLSKFKNYYSFYSEENNHGPMRENLLLLQMKCRQNK